MRLRTLACCAALSAGMVAIPALAQTDDSIEQIVTEIRGLQTKELPALNQIELDEEAVAPQRKELKLWTDELTKGGLHDDMTRVQKEKDEFNAEFARLSAALDQFNRTCVGRMPMAQYNACAQKKAALHAWNVKVAEKKPGVEKDIAAIN